jgi:hypothetical protein
MRTAFDAWPAGLAGEFVAAARVGDDAHERDDDAGKPRYRAIFISDLHLGTPGCQAAPLLDFLKAHPSETCTWWATSSTAGSCAAAGSGRSRTTTWCKSCCARAQGLPRGLRVPATTTSLRASSRAPVRRHRGGARSGARHRRRPRLWVIHGDYFDGVIQCAKWLAYVGDNLYEFTLKLNRHLNHLRGRLGLPYWSLSAYLKHKVKKALNYVTDFEEAVAPRRAGAATRAWSAATSTAPRCATSTARCIATTATGSKAAPRWSSTTTAGWSWCTGRPAGATHWRHRHRRTNRQGGRMKIALVTDAWQPQVNGVVTTLVELVRELRRGPRGGGDPPRPVQDAALPGLRGHRPGRAPGRQLRRKSWMLCSPTPCTSPPKARWAGRRARYCLKRAGWPSPPPFTPSSPKSCTPR